MLPDAARCQDHPAVLRGENGRGPHGAVGLGSRHAQPAAGRDPGGWTWFGLVRFGSVWFDGGHGMGEMPPADMSGCCMLLGPGGASQDVEMLRC